MRSIPSAILNDLYNLSRIAIKKEDMVMGLVEDFRQKSQGQDLIDESVDGFKQVLCEIDKDSLSDLFYETVILNDSIDKKSRTVYVDKDRVFGYKIDNLFRHMYAEKLRSFTGGSIRQSTISAWIKHHTDDVEKMLISPRSAVHLMVDNLSISICPVRNSVTIIDSRTNKKILPEYKSDLEAIAKSWKENIQAVRKKPQPEEALSL